MWILIPTSFLVLSLIDRKDFFIYEKGCLFTLLEFSNNVQNNSHQSEKNYLDQMVEIIHGNIDSDFVRTLLRTNTLLYRGREEITEGLKNRELIRLVNPKPDLFDDKTYGEKEAVAYFECLEKFLKAQNSVVRPSVGHIATPDKYEANQWGEAVSIWPMKKPLNYVWIRNRKLFWPSPSHEDTSNCITDDIVVNIDLETALNGAHEVMFEGSFIEIPSKYDAVLKEKLESKFNRI